MRLALVCASAASLVLLAGPADRAHAQPAGKPRADLPVAQAQGGLTLSQAWRDALANDPSYQAAISEREAGQANRAMGRAGLLPQVSASLGRTRMDGRLEQPDARGNIAQEDLDYTARTNELRATQMVFNWSRIAEYRQGHARADYSLALFDTKSKDTAARLVSRYFQALLSYENAVLAHDYLQASEKHMQVAQHRFDGGEGTSMDVKETRSRRDLAYADQIQAQDNLRVARRELQEMTGGGWSRLQALDDAFRPRPLAPATLEDWLAVAMTGNAEVRTGEQALRIAEREIERAFGGHLPTLDVVASRRVVEKESISTRNQDSATTALGIQASLPVFSGGMTSAQVDQARHNRDKTARELAATRERIAVEVTRQYQAVVSGAQRISALETAVRSARDALAAVEKGYQFGTRSVVDILDAQDQAYRARLDLIQARLQYVLARLLLAGAAGSLDENAIDEATRDYFSKDMVSLG